MIRKRKISIGLTVILLLLIVFRQDALPEEKTVTKALLLSFPGANRGLNPTSLIENAYKESKPFIINMEFSDKFPTPEELKGLEKIFSEIDQVILVVNLQYPPDMRELNPPQEIAQEKYTDEALKMIDYAAKKVAEIIKNYHKAYPEAHILATTSATGGEILVHILKRNVYEISNMVLYYLTMAMVEDKGFVNIFKDNGYNKENVRLIAYKGDPTILQLEKLKTNNEELFTFTVIEEIQDSLVQNNDSSLDYYSRATAYYYKGDNNQAISDYTKAIGLKPDFAEAYGGRASAYGKMGNYDQAISDYTKAIEFNPSFAGAYSGRGNAYASKGNYDQAISDCTKAIELNPSYAEAYNNRGTAYYHRYNFDLAILDYSKAIELNSAYANAYSNRALAYYAEKEYTKSWDDVHKVEDLKSTVDSEFLEALKKDSRKEK